MGSYKMCMCFTRKFGMREKEPPIEVKEAFLRFTDGKNQMTSDQLFQFLVKFQGESETTIEDSDKIIFQILQRRHQIAIFTRNSLTLDDFHHFLFSDDLNPPIITKVSHDMTAPLSHYFIYTGHNSYLTGNQLSSACSDVPIVKALNRGVRVIELDLWPNSSKDDVHVLHGRTLTTPVTLIKCLKSIKENAFTASPYPLVITLEDHLPPKLQAKVAEMVTQTFEDMLFFPKSELKEFPSPEALKYRILLSTKPPKEYLEANSIKDKPKDSSDDDAWGKEIKYESDAYESGRSENSYEVEDLDECDNSKSGQLGAPEYKRLIAIQAKKHKSGLKESLKVDRDKVGRLSLSEQTLEKGTSSHGADLVRFTQKNLLRIYPKGTRFNSSNYNPLIAWMHGAQMVAFNMQGYGRSLWLMQGLFRSNGACGYVKKPECLMNVDTLNNVFNPKAKLPITKTLKVRVYLGDGWRFDFKKTHFDAYSPPDFFVRVEIAGVPADVKKEKTRILEDDWTPVWDEEFFFPLTVPELALLRIEVHEYNMSEKDDFGGQTCLPIRELRTGIRSVPLFNRKGEKYKSVKLLMRFEFV